jgi:tetratricopeptide (TPR) repeat protein
MMLIFPRILVLAVLLSTAAWASDWSDCVAPLNDLERIIYTCTRIIGGGQESQGRLAAVYTNRGAAYDIKGDREQSVEDYDRSIADETMAIKLNHIFVMAYQDRSIAYDNKGDYDLAIIDANTAIKLSPHLGKGLSR